MVDLGQGPDGTAAIRSPPAGAHRPPGVGQRGGPALVSRISTRLPSGSCTKDWRVGPAGRGIGDGHAAAAQLDHRGVQVGHLQGEVLAAVLGRAALHQVELLATGLEPVAAEAEVGSVVALRQPEHVGVEGEGGADVGDGDRHVVHGQRLHPVQSGPVRASALASTEMRGPVQAAARPASVGTDWGVLGAPRPRQVAVLAPMRPELRPLVKAAGLRRSAADPPVYRGTVGDVGVAAMMTGMGLDNAARVTRQLIELSGCDHVLVVGIAGGPRPGPAHRHAWSSPETVLDLASGRDVRRHRARCGPARGSAGDLRRADRRCRRAGPPARRRLRRHRHGDLGHRRGVPRAGHCPGRPSAGISDHTTDDGVDQAVLGLSRPDGTPDLAAVARLVVTHPGASRAWSGSGRWMQTAVDAAVAQALAVDGPDGVHRPAPVDAHRLAVDDLGHLGPPARTPVARTGAGPGWWRTRS